MAKYSFTSSSWNTIEKPIFKRITVPGADEGAKPGVERMGTTGKQPRIKVSLRSGGRGWISVRICDTRDEQNGKQLLADLPIRQCLGRPLRRLMNSFGHLQYFFEGIAFGIPVNKLGQGFELQVVPS
jgi:hypothetical protein